MIARLALALCCLSLLGLGAARPTHAGPSKPDVNAVPYRTVDGVTLTLDIQIPTGTGPWPSLVLVHGGGWHMGAADKINDLARSYSDAGPFVVFNVDYRLAPSYHSPAEQDDVAAAVAWVRANGARYQATATKVGCIGGSAGGHLCSLVGTTGNAGADRPDAVVNGSGPTDLPSLVAEGYPIDPTQYIGCDLSACRPSWEAASPLYRVTSAAPPHWIVFSVGDQVSSAHGQKLDAALRALGVESTFTLVAGSQHGETLLGNGAVQAAAVAFLRAHLTP